MSPDAHWRRNLFAITGACFIGFTGFTLVMPFLPLYLTQLRPHGRRRHRVLVRHQSRHHAGDHGVSVAAVGQAVGSLRPQDHGRAVARLLRHHDGGVRLRDRSRGTSSPSARFKACSRATARWDWRWRAESAPPGKMASAIGMVQTAQRLGPALGPVIGGVLAQLVGLRNGVLLRVGVLCDRPAARVLHVSRAEDDARERREGRGRRRESWP